MLLLKDEVVGHKFLMRPVQLHRSRASYGFLFLGLGFCRNGDGGLISCFGVFIIDSGGRVDDHTLETCRVCVVVAPPVLVKPSS
jgi:hypothetical protein